MSVFEPTTTGLLVIMKTGMHFEKLTETLYGYNFKYVEMIITKN